MIEKPIYFFVWELTTKVTIYQPVTAREQQNDILRTWLYELGLFTCMSIAPILISRDWEDVVQQKYNVIKYCGVRRALVRPGVVVVRRSIGASLGCLGGLAGSFPRLRRLHVPGPRSVIFWTFLGRARPSLRHAPRVGAEIPLA